MHTDKLVENDEDLGATLTLAAATETLACAPPSMTPFTSAERPIVPC